LREQRQPGERSNSLSNQAGSHPGEHNGPNDPRRASLRRERECVPAATGARNLVGF
jgi:hypothetical protein